MNYVHTVTGRAVLSSSTKYYHTLNSRFKLGDFAWLRSQAIKGRLERVCVKKVNGLTVQNYQKYQYFDTFNAFHDEKELVTESYARFLANL